MGVRWFCTSHGGFAALQELAGAKRPWVVIDEVQKVPDLLSLVHRYIQKRKFRFALTGSSARKLKRGGADLLGGRASWFELSSLTHVELGESFDLNTVLRWGSLPEIFSLEDSDRARFLEAYCALYLREEIIVEQLVRNVQPFRNFLELVALRNPRALAGALEGILEPRTAAYGKCFEQFVITEVRRLMQGYARNWRLSYLTSKDGAEIDLIVEKPSTRIALEIKSYEQVEEKEVRAFERLAGDLRNARLLFASRDPLPRRYGEVECLHWKDALAEIFK